MSFEPVDVYLQDPNRNAVEGVFVKVYDSTGTRCFGMATTDANGHVGFLLETMEYTLRFYQFSTSFQQPQHIVVLESPAVNAFNIRCTPFVAPYSNDPRLCTASGFFRSITGAPNAYLDMHFINRFTPILLEGSGVFSERVHTRTDEDGYVQLDLIRCAEYCVVIEGMEDKPRKIMVPDQSSVNLPDLILPVAESVTFAEGVPPFTVQVGVGNELTLTPSLLASSGLPLQCINLDVNWQSSDPAVLGVSIVGGKTVQLRGLSPGSAQVLLTRNDQSIIRIPNTPITGQPVDVAVIP
jgi:hypothetical protein